MLIATILYTSFETPWGLAARVACSLVVIFPMAELYRILQLAMKARFPSIEKISHHLLGLHHAPIHPTPTLSHHFHSYILSALPELTISAQKSHRCPLSILLSSCPIRSSPYLVSKFSVARLSSTTLLASIIYHLNHQVGRSLPSSVSVHQKLSSSAHHPFPHPDRPTWPS